jgi:hypothetical protein
MRDFVPTGQLEISQTQRVWFTAPTCTVLKGRRNPSSFQDEQTSRIIYQPLRSWLISSVAPRHFQRSHKVIVALTVQEILDEHIAKKLV